MLNLDHVKSAYQFSVIVFFSNPRHSTPGNYVFWGGLNEEASYLCFGGNAKPTKNALQFIFFTKHDEEA